MGTSEIYKEFLNFCNYGNKDGKSCKQLQAGIYEARPAALMYILIGTLFWK
jgi:hypothetical protein